MEKVIIERKIALFDELTEEQQVAEIEKLTNSKDGLQMFFEDAFTCYDYALKDIEAETVQDDPVKYKAVKFIRDNVCWQSGSQGWYYDHCSVEDFLKCKDFYRQTKNYTLELRDGWRYKEDKTWVPKYAFEWYLSLAKGGIESEWTGEFADIQKQFENDGWDIPAIVIRTVKAQEELFGREFEELIKRVEEEIWYYDRYWPTDEEVAEYFRLNAVEFVIEENETERVVI
jgi:hypothetical protein